MRLVSMLSFPLCLPSESLHKFPWSVGDIPKSYIAFLSFPFFFFSFLFFLSLVSHGFSFGFAHGRDIFLHF